MTPQLPQVPVTRSMFGTGTRPALPILEARRAEMAVRGWHDEILKALVLQAIALDAGGREDESLGLAIQAMDSASSGGFIRLFLDEGESMERLLARGAALASLPAHGSAILAAFAAERSSREAAAASAASPSQSLADPLSERELEVLRLLSTDLSGPDIARELVVSLHTVRSHTKNVYAKLGVNDRRAAVRRAGELDLLSRTGDR